MLRLVFSFSLFSECTTKYGDSYEKKYFPYPKIQVEFIQQSGDKIHDFRCVVYIDGPLLCHEYKNSITISGEQMYKVFISFKLKSDIF